MAIEDNSHVQGFVAIDGNDSQKHPLDIDPEYVMGYPRSSGSSTTLAERLDTLVSIGGTQTITGEKTFTAPISGTISVAEKLQTARNLGVALNGSAAAPFDGSANQLSIPVSGTLPIANGGTGATAVADIQAGKDGAGNTITSTYATKADVADEMATKANVDGNYPDMTVGNAEQLVSEDYLTDTAPYTFRTAGGNVDIGDREYDELVGGTIAWNQLMSGMSTATADGITTSYDATTHLFTIQNDSRTSNYNAGSTRYTISLEKTKQGHKYALIATSSDDITGVGVTWFALTGDTFIPVNGIGVPDASDNYFLLRVTKDYDFVTKHPVGDITTFYLNLFDLTAMFGSAIADYIYGLEQANAGAGVAWFRAHFPKDYYAFDLGSLQSVQAASHDMVGFNAYDTTSGTAVLLGGNQYQITGTYTALAYSTGETITPDASGLFTPSADGTLTVTGGNGTDTCVHLVWSGYRNGEYEPYQKNTYPLDSTLTLRGIPKLDASNNLVYDGDTYASDGTVTRRYSSVDLGTVVWTKNTGLATSDRFYVSFAGIKNATVNDVPNAFCDKFVAIPLAIASSNYTNGVFGQQLSTLYFYTTPGTYADAAAFKSAMSGVYLVYELATPTTETADAFQTPQIVNDFGTEQYVDAAVAAGTRDVAIPVGHDTRYTQNLRDKLRRLPNMPDSEGLYLVRYDDRQCEFEEYAIPYSDATPQELGDATAGTSTNLSRADHVHERPVEIDIDRKKLDNVLSLMNGALSVQQADATAAYTKTVPAKAQPYAAIDAIGGKTVCWNQIIYNGDFSLGTTSWGYPSGITMTVADNVATMTVAADGDNYAQQAYSGVVGHKYLLLMDVWSDTADISPARVYYGGAADTSYHTIQAANTWETFAVVFECATNQYNFVRLRNPRATTTTKYRNIHLHDLTSLYEAGNEPTTVAEFQSRYPASYYAYNLGSLISAGVTGAVSVGRNLLYIPDGVYAAIPTNYFGAVDGLVTVFGETQTASNADAVYIKTWERFANYGTSTVISEANSLLLYPGTYTLSIQNVSGNFANGLIYVWGVVGSIGDTYQTGVKYFYKTVSSNNLTETFTITSPQRIAISIQKEAATAQTNVSFNIQIERGSTATTYTPYQSDTLAIPAAVQQLPGYGWSAGSVYNEVDWVAKKYIQRVGSVDLGTLIGWTYNSMWGSGPMFYTHLKGISGQWNFGIPANVICQKYPIVARDDMYNTSTVTGCCISGGVFVTIRDTNYTDAAALKTALSGVMFYYPLATPVETDISSLLSDDNLIAVEPGGTVTFPSQLGDDYRLSVPSDVEYTIDMAPDAPTTDGTYTLQCTVADGVATYSWVSA